MSKKEQKDNIIRIRGSQEAGERNAEQQQIKNTKKRWTAIGVLLCLILGIVIYTISRNWEYKGYKIVESSQTDYENTANYIQFGDNLLKYTSDGASYIDSKGYTVWATGINMKVPVAAVSGDYAVVADMNGNSVCVFNTEGQVSSQTMPYPISDIDVGDQGVFAVVLESEKTNYVNLYNRKGDIIYEIQSTIGKNGYPLDIAISDNGEKLFVSYMNIGNGVMKNTLTAYNFGDVGQNTNADRIVGSYEFDDQVFSKVEFIDNNTVAAFGTKSIELYTMKEKPSVKKSIQFLGEVRSIFYGTDYVGVIQKNTNENAKHPYTIRCYNMRGNNMFSEAFDFDYDNIFTDDEEILVTGGKNCIIFRKNGSVKFQGTLKNRIRSIVPSGKHLEYVVVYENETQVIRLKNTLPDGTKTKAGTTTETGITVTTESLATPEDAEEK